MNVKIDDLIAYLTISDDWHGIGTDPKWLTFDGPADAEGDSIQIMLPCNPYATDAKSYITIAVGILAALEGIHADTMADRITPSSVKALMDVIKYFDCEPSVFVVTLLAADHRTGYTANVDFRTTGITPTDSVSTHGDSPEQALARLLDVLKAKWIRCPHCGQHLNGKDQEASTL